MTTDHWNRIRELFLEACDLSATERSTYLAQACGGDEGLRSEVEELLKSSVEASEFLDSPPAGAGKASQDSDEPAPWTNQMIGSYRLTRMLGKGGMGAVYLAERADEQFHKQVAIKLLRTGAMDEESLRRFRAERQMLAMLEHVNIARLLDGGVTADGTPYLVMEYVEGASIVQYCDDHRLPTTARLRLFRQVCEAVEYAHRKLIVHRDLKPSNILVTKDGTPKLLDFGIAKLLRSDEGPVGDDTVTAAAQRPLTPEYASPEQIRGDPVATASDVYSLGVIVYRLLTGHRPYKMAARHVRAIERSILETEPVPPSSVIWRVEETAGTCDTPAAGTPQTISAVRDGTPQRLSRRLRGDLDNVILKALRKEPERRYSSARALADDIDNYLANRPVTARRDTVAYRSLKFMRRHLAGVSAATMVALAILVATAGIVWQAREARDQRDAALTAEADAQAVVRFLEDMLLSAKPGNAGADALVRDVLAEAAEKVVKWDDVSPLVVARVRSTIGRVYATLGLYEEAEPHLRAALAIRNQELGRADAASIEAASDLGNLLAGVGRLEEAEPVLRDALAGSATLSGNDVRLIEDLKVNLSELLTERGAVDEAERLLRDVLAAQRQRLSPSNPELAQTIKRLATVAARRGDYPQAEALLTEAVRLNESAGPRGMAFLLENLMDLAGVLHGQGCEEEARVVYRRAEQPCRRALMMHRKMMGDDHLMTITLMNDLGAVAAAIGDFNEAERWLRLALRGTEKLAERDQHNIARVRNNLGCARHSLGTILLERGELDEAEAMFRAALDIRRESVGSRRLELAETLAGLADLRDQRGDDAEANRLRREALAIRRKLLAETHPEVRRLVSLLKEEGDPE